MTLCRRTPRMRRLCSARQKDPFANPVGHSLREGTRGIFEALLDGTDAEKIRDTCVRSSRSEQSSSFPPPEAVGFIFGLKEAIRAELGKAARGSAGFDRVDEVRGRDRPDCACRFRHLRPVPGAGIRASSQ